MSLASTDPSVPLTTRISVSVRSRLVPRTAFALLAMLLSGCGKPEGDERAQAHAKRLTGCAAELAKDKLVPIIGGGKLDTSRFAFNVPAVRYEEGQCGTDGFVTDFYWTGKEILPADPLFTGVRLTDMPSNWRLYQVGVVLANMRKARHCTANPDAPECPKTETPGYPAVWPQELIHQPKHYPSLQIWWDSKPAPKGLETMSFVLSSWRREDGRPRTVNCDIRRELSSLSRAEIEGIDLRAQTLPCRVEFWDFQFKGGAARVTTSTQSLEDITPALQALHAYISKSIIQEVSK